MSMPVSGPGALSRRTDTQAISTPTGLPYGEAGALAEAQRQAPLPATPAPLPITDLDAPTARPNEPVTAGAPFGPGPGPEALSTAAVGRPAGGPIAQAIARAAASDPSGELAQLLLIAQQKGV